MAEGNGRHRVVLFGAWGCGAFGKGTEAVARQMAAVARRIEGELQLQDGGLGLGPLETGERARFVFAVSDKGESRHFFFCWLPLVAAGCCATCWRGRGKRPLKTPGRPKSCICCIYHVYRRSQVASKSDLNFLKRGTQRAFFSKSPALRPYPLFELAISFPFFLSFGLWTPLALALAPAPPSIQHTHHVACCLCCCCPYYYKRTRKK